MEKTKHSAQSGRMAAVFSVAAVLFSWHAGGGFATGNQANQYFLVSGKLGLVSALLALLLLTMTVRQAIVMYNSRRLGFNVVHFTWLCNYDRKSADVYSKQKKFGSNGGDYERLGLRRQHYLVLWGWRYSKKQRV